MIEQRFPPPCPPGTRVRFFQRHRGLTPDTHGEGLFVSYVISITAENWVVMDGDGSGRSWSLNPEFGDTMEPV